MKKLELLNKIKINGDLSQDEKSYLINLVNTKKKYGLVWEEKPEEIEEALRYKLPIFKEDKALSIIKSEEDLGCPNNLLIVGDNLHALTALTFTHEEQIDLIYIDPPYNTGNKDFIYNDQYVDKEDSYRHSKWLSFMNKRLTIAKRLLSNKGVIFISIDDNEFMQLKLLCDEIFGESNFIAAPVRRRRGSQANLSLNISTIHEYVLIYRKSINAVLNNLSPKLDESSYKNPDNDPRGPYVTMPCTNKGGAKYSIATPTGHNYEDEWRFKIETYQQLHSDNRIVFPRKGNGKPRYKLFLSEKKLGGVIANSWWDDVATNQEGSSELKNIFGGETMFNNPKPVGLLTRILELGLKENSTVLDFFAGSGTTLNAVMEFNKENGTKHKCILVTNNENNIAQDVCFERNKRIILGYSKPDGTKIDGLPQNNLRYFNCDFVNREPTVKNKQLLTMLSTDLLCIKEDCYNDITSFYAQAGQDWFKLFTDKNGQFLLTVHNDSCIENAVELLGKLIQDNDISKPIKVYVFSNGQYPYTDEFEIVLDQIMLCALPDAIYKAYLNVLPPKQHFIIPEIEEPTPEETENIINSNLTL